MQRVGTVNKVISTDSGIILKKYIKVFIAGWFASIVILGTFAFGFWYNNAKTAKAEVEYWNKQRDQVGKETTVRQINEYNYNK